MAAVTGKAFDIGILKRIFTYLKPYKKTFYFAVFLTILLAALSGLRPELSQIAIDDYILNNDYKGLIKIALIILSLLFIQSVIQFYFGVVTNLLGQNVIRDLRNKLYDHLQHFELKFFDRTPIGTPVTRLVSDMETIADIFSDGLLLIISDMLQVVVIIGVMLWINWQLALISLCTIPLLFLATRIFQKKIKEVFKEVRIQVSRLNEFVQEHITGMRIVQVFSREETEMEKFRAINALHRDANIKSVWYYSIFFPVVEILSAISIGLLVWYAAQEVIVSRASFGDIVAFIMYINLLFRPIRELADKFNTLQMGMVSSERILKLMDQQSEEINTGKVKADNLKGNIRFENVWFAYNNEEWVLKNISFEIKPGQSVALVGATGSGKTSIINLLNRSYVANSGKIYLDGIDIMEYDLYSLRNRIAYVLQDVFLFSGSVKNNITLFNPGISDREIMEAAKEVGADQFINNLPGRFDFPVQERGNSLSMGQRQLISYVRAYVYRPSIMVLDEATSSIDSETEELIINATARITRGRSSILIAHRLSTIQNADVIMVLDHGEILETGTSQELLQKEGLYKQLYETQFNYLNEV